jgi:hypothetical protein
MHENYRLNNTLITTPETSLYSSYLSRMVTEGRIFVSNAKLSPIIADKVICHISNPASSGKIVMLERMAVFSTTNLSFTVNRNGTLAGTLDSLSIYNANDYFTANHSAQVYADAGSTLNVTGGSDLLSQISMPNVYNPVEIVPLAIKPGSSLYIFATITVALSFAANFIWWEYSI